LKIALGSDHAGFPLKEKIKQFLLKKGHEVVDFGTLSESPTDYPIYAKKVALAVSKGEVDKGILVCGTGIGMSIVANKFKGIRAALCLNEYMARMSRKHNNSNILCLGDRVVGEELAFSIVQAWLEASFEGGRHRKRLEIIEEIEKNRRTHGTP